MLEENDMKILREVLGKTKIEYFRQRPAEIIADDARLKVKGPHV